MIDVNRFENRIVNFKRISAGVETIREAEVRQIDYDQMADIPRSVTARFVKPLNAVMTLGYDTTLEKFRGPLGPDMLESDFDIKEFISSSKMGITDRTIRSPKRNRARF